MTLMQLLLRNLRYHWRGNFAVLLGVVVGTAVLTGALLVGDSLRGSLRDLTLRRLGWVDQALVGSRFFRASLADNLPARRAAPAILLRASADKPAGGAVNRVTVLGVDQRFGLDELPEGPSGVILGAALARDLGAKVGDPVTLHVQKAAEVPRESLLGQREADTEALRLQVSAIRPEDDPAGRFSLDPSPEPPRNAFVRLAVLQELLDQPGRANALLVGKPDPGLGAVFRAQLDLDDWGLRLTTPTERADTLFARYDSDGDGVLRTSEWYKGMAPGRRPQSRFATTYAWGLLDPEHKNERNHPLPRRELTRQEFEKYFNKQYGYLSLESRQLVLEPAVVQAALAAAKEADLRAAPTLVYLCKIEARGKRVVGIVAALDPTLGPPLGPFLPAGKTALADDEIALVEWKDEPTLPTLNPGDQVTLIYKPPEHQPGKLPDHQARFRFAGTIPLSGPADDPELTPPFPGITDKDDPRQWKLPFEDPNDRAWMTDTVRREYGDPLFWGEQRTTPKAYITLAAGQKLWASRFGDLTSIRMAPQAGGDLAAARQRFAEALKLRLDPEAGGFTFQKVKAETLQASMGGTDFSGLFVGFSFFLIAAALLLVSLLFRLNLDRRAAEVGLLLATGYRRSTVGRLLLGEGLVLALVGAALGVGVALGYAALLLRLLAALWPEPALGSFLRPHYADAWLSLVIGYAGSVLIASLTIAWTLRGLARIPPRTLLAGVVSTETTITAPARSRWSWRIAGLALIAGVGLLAFSGKISDHEMKAGAFFSGGGLLLTGFIAALAGWLGRGERRPIEQPGGWSVARLGVRNAGRNRLRSMLTAGLLASAAFLVVAVESFRRHASGDENRPDSPSGGFNLLGESDLPLFDNPVQAKGLERIGKRLEAVFLKETGKEDEARRRTEQALELLRTVEVVPLRLRPGDDASCLNLYEVRQPRLLGVPAELIQRGGFQFAKIVPADSAAVVRNPWLLLEGDGKEVPVFGEQNTVIWMLHKGLGKSLPVTAGDGKERDLKIVGLLQDSVFQSSLLMSEERFLKLYPEHQGYNVFLIRAPQKEAEVRRLLELGLADRGLEVTPTAERLQSYLAVENTYLSTFQALGGLGLLLGSLGLAVVLLRGVWERRAELALLRALGYRRSALGEMVLAENGFLLLAGLAAGSAAALLSVLPYVVGEGTSIHWRNLLLLLGLVPIVGLVSAGLAVVSTLRAPLLPALRRE